MNEKNSDLYKIIIGLCALVLCVLFFVLPLLTHGRLTVTGWRFVVGYRGFASSPFMILLLIAPAILSFFAFSKKPFIILRNVSIICLVCQIIFLIIATTLLATGLAGTLTSFSWVILLIYGGLCIFTFFCAKNEKSNNSLSENLKKCPFCTNDIKVEAIVCQFCSKDLPKNEKSNNSLSENLKKCPFCANDIKVEAIVCQFCRKDLPK